MKHSNNRFITWLMSLPVITRCLVIAILFHLALLLVLILIKIPVMYPKIIATFEGVVLPASKQEEPDPFAAYRDFDYNGPTLGGGGGTPGKGPGGTPAESKPSILQPDTKADTQIGAVIGVDVADAAGAIVRLQGSPGSVSAPTIGLGETMGVTGPGGGGFSQRVGPMRAQALQKFKGSAETEKAVIAGLRWLKVNQRADGSWSCAKSDRAGTALAVLAFLGHGETADSEEFGACVNKGLQYLVTQVGPDGLVVGREAQGYAQGIVALALSEAYGMTQAQAIREPLERAIRAITISQKVKKKESKFVGGWRYSPTSDDADTSVSGWMIMALKSARLTGVVVPEESFDLASQFLWAMYGDGGFGYSGPGKDWGPTAIGVLCQQFMGHGDDKRVKQALDFLKEQKADWEKTKSAYVLYGWYYQTQAMFQGGGSYWEYWNRQIRDTMVKSQSADGHWPLPPQSEWELKSVGKDSPVYSTALGCLILEVYYRYLPIYQQATTN